MIIVKERGMRRGGPATQGVVGRAVDEIDVEPSVVVIVEKTDAGAVGLNDELLLRRAHDVSPCGETGLFGDVLKDDGAGFDEASSSDGAVLGVVNCGVRASGGVSAATACLRSFLSMGTERKNGCQQGGSREARISKQTGNSCAG